MVSERRDSESTKMRPNQDDGDLSGAGIEFSPGEQDTSVGVYERSHARLANATQTSL